MHMKSFQLLVKPASLWVKNGCQNVEILKFSWLLSFAQILLVTTPDSERRDDSNASLCDGSIEVSIVGDEVDSSIKSANDFAHFFRGLF